MQAERLNAFFRVYKDLPEGGDIELNGFGDASEARDILSQAFDAY
jgi:inorganic pyrophosphatase